MASSGFFLGGAARGSALDRAATQKDRGLTQIDRQIGQGDRRLDLTERQIGQEDKRFGLASRAQKFAEDSQTIELLGKRLERTLALGESFKTSIEDQAEVDGLTRAQTEERLRAGGAEFLDNITDDLFRPVLSAENADQIGTMFITPSRTASEDSTVENVAKATGIVAQRDTLVDLKVNKSIADSVAGLTISDAEDIPTVLNFRRDGTNDTMKILSNDVEALEAAANLGFGPTGALPAVNAIEFQMFRIPGGDPVAVDTADPVAMKAVREAGGTAFTQSIQAETPSDLNQTEQFSPQEVAATRVAIRSYAENKRAVDDMLESFEDVRQAAGIKGKAISTIGGYISQFDELLGTNYAEELGTEGVAAVRTEAMTLTSRLLETITQETSGRFTGPERDLAADALRVLKPDASLPVIRESLGKFQQVMLRDIRDKTDEVRAQAGVKPEEFMTSAGAKKVFDILVDTGGLTTNEAMDAINLLRDFRIEGGG